MGLKIKNKITKISIQIKIKIVMINRMSKKLLSQSKKQSMIIQMVNKRQ